MKREEPRVKLLGRRTELSRLDHLVADVRAGHSGTLVLRGEAGIGKTELLRYLLERSEGCRTVHAVGIESEMEISYAALHQICRPVLDRLDRLPGPQQEALAIAFGLRAGDPPGRFLVGLATLSLLADAATAGPLVCVVDDAQWLDQASASTLAFVARRLLAESVLLVFAVREPTPTKALVGLPDLSVRALDDRDSRALLDIAVTGPLDARVRERILAETRGNPLAILELPRSLTAAELGAGISGPTAQPLSSKIEHQFRQRVEALPPETQLLLVLAAAEPVGDIHLLRQAAARLGIDVDVAATQGDASELLALGARVRFRHPLVRSAAYQLAAPNDRRAAHQAIADSIDVNVDIDRKTWHSALAATEADEAIADALERSATRAHARGGAPAMAAFLERAADMTEDTTRRAQRSLEAAHASFQAGAFDSALVLLTRAESGPPDDLRSARIDVLRAGLAFAQGRGSEAPALLLGAARRLERLDVSLSRATYLEATSAVIFAGHLAGTPGFREIGESARAAPQAVQPRLADMLLDALAVRLANGFAASVSQIESVLAAFSEDDVPLEDSLRWLLLAGVVAADLWDLDRWQSVAARHVRVTRESGALSELPLALDSWAFTLVFAGDLSQASSVIEEVKTVSGAIGSIQPPFGAMALAAVRGREHEARPLIDAAIRDASRYGQGTGLTTALACNAILLNGLGHHDLALAAAREAAENQQEFGAPRWALVELIEAATRCDEAALAADALELLTENTRVVGTDWALGVSARSRALVSRTDAAEKHYREAIERLERTRLRTDVARAHLLFGEWLRLRNRRTDARSHLGIAHDLLSGIGAEAFAERARHELAATGATVRKRSVASSSNLTPQESQIARLAADGLTNQEIGTRLFLSPHTAEWHLRKVYAKLGVASRKELPAVLNRDASTSA